MTIMTKSLKHGIAAAACGFAFCVLAAPLSAQTPDAKGLPRNESTPQEKAETAKLNSQISQSNNAADAKAAADQAQYQAQQQQYQEQMRQHDALQQQYQDRTAAYESLRDRYAAERAAYRRRIWPGHYARWAVETRDARLIGAPVQLVSGRNVGHVVDTARSKGGGVEALLVRLDNDKMVWIDSEDARYNRADGIVMTNLEGADLRRMADERL
ncbi:MAG TPA: hypothetical protein VHC40_03290 [Rhizomicrobium sp.]|nr:hypothetical protein [Rhizomicrobium sp.]